MGPTVDVTCLQLWRLPDTDHMDVLLHTEPAGDRVWSVAVSPDGRWVDSPHCLVAIWNIAVRCLY